MSPVTVKSPSLMLLPRVSPLLRSLRRLPSPGGCSPAIPSKGLSLLPPSFLLLSRAWLCLSSASVPEGCSNLLIFGRCCHRRQRRQRAGIEHGHCSAPARKGVAGVNVRAGSREQGWRQDWHLHPQNYLLPCTPPSSVSWDHLSRRGGFWTPLPVCPWSHGGDAPLPTDARLDVPA